MYLACTSSISKALMAILEPIKNASRRHFTIWVRSRVTLTSLHKRVEHEPTWRSGPDPDPWCLRLEQKTKDFQALPTRILTSSSELALPVSRSNMTSYYDVELPPTENENGSFRFVWPRTPSSRTIEYNIPLTNSTCWPCYVGASCRRRHISNQLEPDRLVMLTLM